MATELETIIARLEANTSEMRRGFDDMRRKAKQTTGSIGDSFDRLGQRVQSIGKKMVLSITTPFAALVGFSVKTASDVQEMENLIAVTFGNATQDVEDWADRTAIAVNRSSDVMLRAAGDFAAFLKPLGIAPDRIAPMSIALSQLVTDVSSFRNIAEEDVFIKFFSGLAGEPEAMRRLGVDIGQTAIEAELLALGFDGVAIEASQSQKVLARYNIIMRQTADAQGDAVRTSQFFENQTRGLAATIRDIRIAIGNQLLPTATELVGKLKVLGQRFLNLTEEAQRTILIFGGIAAAIGPALLILGTFIRIVAFAGSGLVSFAVGGVRAVGFLLKAFKMLATGVITAVRVFATSIFTIPGIVAASIAAAIAAVLLFPATLREIFSMDALRAILDNFTVAFQNFVIDPVFKMMNNLIIAMNNLPGIELDLFKLAPPAKVREDTKEFAANLANVFQEELTRVKGQLTSAVESVTSVFGNLLPESLKNALDEIKSIDFDMSELLKADEATGDLTELEQRLNSVFTQFNDLGENMNDHLVNASLNAKDLADDLREAFIGRLADINSLGDAMTAVFDRLKAQLLEIAFFGTTGTGGLFGGTFAKIAGAFAGFFGGARADGGPVQANRAFIVGEKGPEMFVPQSSGTVVNARATAAGGRRGDIIIHQTITLPNDDTELNERIATAARIARDQAVSAFRVLQNTGF